jgi:GNAT superfamily N-acetyltransferase
MGGICLQITYKKTKDFGLDELSQLYISVGWNLGNYPEELQASMKNSHNVFSAWYEDKLVGIINCISDGVITVYFNNLLVNPEYQGNGIGSVLVNMMLEEYKSFRKKILIADNTKAAFYKTLGFKVGDEVIPMMFFDKQ